ncbi:hypothetical protein EDB85DRAFT_1896667 [Lactarius pseudohatsudake]|nr:hypothetical protein EDB85DRAFT_1896667 [Lactarius pseudohatsudake]
MRMTVTRVNMPPGPRHMAACGVRLTYLNTRPPPNHADICRSDGTGAHISSDVRAAHSGATHTGNHQQKRLPAQGGDLGGTDEPRRPLRGGAALSTRFPRSVASPKSSSSTTHAWRAVGRAGGQDPTTACVKERDAVPPRATPTAKRTQARGPTAVPRSRRRPLHTQRATTTSRAARSASTSLISSATCVRTSAVLSQLGDSTQYSR